MPESSNIEMAHRLHERAEHEATPRRRHEVWIEVGEAVLLALVAIATAWSGYQSALWDGRSAQLYGTSSRIRIQASQSTTRGGQQQVYDGTTVNFWLQATLTGHKKLAAGFEKRFTPEFRPAFRAWLATHPLTNPDAPPGPMFVPQYRNALVERGRRQSERASAVFEHAAAARETGDKYVRMTVLLATVLFLIAVSQRFRIAWLRMALLCIAVALLVVAVTSIATYPRL